MVDHPVRIDTVREQRRDHPEALFRHGVEEDMGSIFAPRRANSGPAAAHPAGSGGKPTARAATDQRAVKPMARRWWER